MPGEIAMRTRLGLIAVLVHLPWSRKEDKINFGVSSGGQSEPVAMSKSASR